MGSAVVTAQDYYDVSDTEAGSDDFAVRWGKKKDGRWTPLDTAGRCGLGLV